MQITSEWPLVTREDCWRAYRPGQPFSESAFKRLRSKGLISDGVRVEARSKGRLAGHHRLYSRLNLLAVEELRAGHTEHAEQLAKNAASIEAMKEFVAIVDVVVAGGLSDPFVASWDQWETHWVKNLPFYASFQAVCKRGDSLSTTTDRVQSKVLAQVSRIYNGRADLLIGSGERVAYTQSKLSHIARDSVGAKVWLYLLDIGGADELVRARPAVDLVGQPTGERPNVRGGLYGSSQTRLSGEHAVTFHKMLAGSPTISSPDLTGLRVLL